MKIMTKAVLIGVLALLAGAQAWAVTPIASCPFIITVPGNYVVTADLTCAGSGINITSSNVTLNLNGHIITGPGLTATIGIYLGSATPTRLDHVSISGPASFGVLMPGFCSRIPTLGS